MQSDQAKYRGEFTKEDIVSASPRHDSDQLYVGGADIMRYSVERLRYLPYDQYLPRIKRPRFPALFCSPKVMIGYTSGGLYDDGVSFSQTDARRWLFCNHNVLLAVPWRFLSAVSNRSIASGLRHAARILGGKRHRDELEKASDGYSVAALAALCLSRAVSAYTVCNLRRSEMSLTEDQLKAIPIRRIHFTTPDKERTALVEGLKGMYREWVGRREERV